MLETQSTKLPAAGICAAVTILFWAGSFPAITLGLTGFDPLPIAAFRFLIASLALFGIVVFRNGGPTLPTIRDAAWFLFYGALGIAIYNFLLNTGQKTVSPAAASFLIACQPIFAAIVAIVFFRQRFGRAGWIGTGISLGGAAIIATGQPGGLDLGAGAPLILMASVCSGAFFAFQRPLIARYDPLVSSFWTLLAGAVLLSPWAIWGWDQLGTGRQPAVDTACRRVAELDDPPWRGVRNRRRLDRVQSQIFMVPAEAEIWQRSLMVAASDFRRPLA